jgi:NAD(P)-dependent dehydrogenase (short-subunit alcohol dehydrogenase family)
MSPLVWLVTGCSSGFGEAFVHSILARGDKVIATARNAETRLTPLKEKGASILNLDVTASQGEIDSIIKEAIGIYGRIDILINNAGTLKMRFLEEVTYVYLRLSTLQHLNEFPLDLTHTKHRRLAAILRHQFLRPCTRYYRIASSLPFPQSW